MGDFVCSLELPANVRIIPAERAAEAARALAQDPTARANDADGVVTVWVLQQFDFDVETTRARTARAR